MFHPAAALHNASLRPALEEDFANLKNLIREAQGKPDKKVDEDKGEQLSLF
jgi:hypothetical protein